MANKLHISFLHLLSTFLFCGASYPSLEPATISQTTENLTPEKAVGVNISLALCRQRHHLQDLFARYGENNTLNIEGFKKLLRNIGIEKVKRIDHNHYHHHHNHATLRTNFDKTNCPNDESGGGSSKGFWNNPAKDVPRTENMEDHEQESMDNKSTNVAMTTGTYTTTTEGNPLLQHSETAELSARVDSVSSNPSTVLESSSNVSF